WGGGRRRRSHLDGRQLAVRRQSVSRRPFLVPMPVSDLGEPPEPRRGDAARDVRLFVRGGRLRHSRASSSAEHALPHALTRNGCCTPTTKFGIVAPLCLRPRSRSIPSTRWSAGAGIT